jgi:nucleoid DNA-binding protein
MAKPEAKKAAPAKTAAPAKAAKKSSAKKPTKVFIEAIVDAVKEKHPDLTKKVVSDVLADATDTILDCLTSGVAVNMNKLGTFTPIVRPARKQARLPDGSLRDLPAKKSVRFSPSTKIYSEAVVAA